jgi:predicted phosphodiesterase
MPRPNRIALFSDIHANHDALDAVLADMKRERVNHRICLGDIVGYGAEPARCLATVRKLRCPIVLGNHDREASSGESLSRYRDLARIAMEFTRRALLNRQKTILRNLPLVYEADAFTVVHSSLVHPEEFYYVESALEAEFHLAEQNKFLSFIGHTHVPGAYIKRHPFQPVSLHFPHSPLTLDPSLRYLVNVGSVGQPRDGDWRACYVIYNVSERTVTWRRVEYDVGLARKKIFEAGLPEGLGERLLAGM